MNKEKRVLQIVKRLRPAEITESKLAAMLENSGEKSQKGDFGKWKPLNL